MAQSKHLLVGGLVALGFDATGKYLLTVSHTGRGVFSTDTWERVARDPEVVYPTNDRSIGIGPINGQSINVVHRDERRERIEVLSPDGIHFLIGVSDGVTITPT
jgi:hypothetical protein